MCTIIDYDESHCNNVSMLGVFFYRFLPVKKDPETSFRLTIQPSYEEEFLDSGMRLCKEVDGVKFSNDVILICKHNQSYVPTLMYIGDRELLSNKWSDFG